MRTLNTNASNEDSFKFSILCSLHYYDIDNHPERISNLESFEDRYNFTDNTPEKFEINNPNVSLTVYDEWDKKIYHSITNDTEYKASIAKINNYGYAVVKPLRSRYIKLNNYIQSYSSHKQLSKKLFQIILNNIDGIESRA